MTKKGMPRNDCLRCHCEPKAWQSRRCKSAAKCCFPPKLHQGYCINILRLVSIIRMKLSKTAQWILVLGILVALLVGVVTVYGRQRATQGGLNSELTRVNQDFAKYTAQKGDLQGRLNKAQSDLSNLKKDFRQSTQSVEITGAIFEAADKSNVDIGSITSSLPAKGGEGAGVYDVFTLTIEAKGEVVALLKFCGKLSETFPDSVIGTVTIGVSEAGGESTISVVLTVYCYEGS